MNGWDDSRESAEGDPIAGFLAEARRRRESRQALGEWIGAPTMIRSRNEDADSFDSRFIRSKAGEIGRDKTTSLLH